MILDTHACIILLSSSSMIDEMGSSIRSLQEITSRLEGQIAQSLDLATTNMKQNKLLEEQIVDNGEFYDSELKNMRQHVEDAGK